MGRRKVMNPELVEQDVTTVRYLGHALAAIAARHPAAMELKMARRLLDDWTPVAPVTPVTPKARTPRKAKPSSVRELRELGELVTP